MSDEEYRRAARNTGILTLIAIGIATLVAWWLARYPGGV